MDSDNPVFDAHLYCMVTDCQNPIQSVLQSIKLAVCVVRPAPGVRAWTQRYLTWVKQEVHFAQQAQEFTLLDYVHEVEHATLRIGRLARAMGVQAESPVQFAGWGEAPAGTAEAAVAT